MMMKRAIRMSSIGTWLLLCVSGALAQEFVDIEIKEFLFTPPEVTVTQGTTVRWTNMEKRQYHNVWFEALGDEEPEYLFPGDLYEKRFDVKGSFPYHCGPHPEMQGVVHVQ
jgi:plastocyanin